MSLVHRLVNETSNKWRLVFVKKLRHAVIETRVFDGTCMLPPTCRRC
jgi:hypothetical protein